MSSLKALSIAIVATGLLAPGCAQDDGTTDDTNTVAISAGERARIQFGVDHFVVRTSSATATTVELLATDGALVGEVMAFPLGDAEVVRVTADGSVTDVVAGVDTVTIVRDGVVRYTVDRDQADAAEDFDDFSDSAMQLPEDLGRSVAIAAAVVTDQGLIDHLTVTQAYAVRDCPWWVTLAACAGWETGVGAIMCVACGLSYLL